MTKPPRLAAWLLETTVAASHRDAVIGDLYEEFAEYVVPARGRFGARVWFCWQVARSLPPLFFRSWERASLTRAAAAVVGAGIAATVPATALIAVRTFVLQQVPLKTTAELSVSFSVALLGMIMATAACGVVAAIEVVNTDRRNR